MNIMTEHLAREDQYDDIVTTSWNTVLVSCHSDHCGKWSAKFICNHWRCIPSQLPADLQKLTISCKCFINRKISDKINPTKKQLSLTCLCIENENKASFYKCTWPSVHLNTSVVSKLYININLYLINQVSIYSSLLYNYTFTVTHLQLQLHV